MKKALLFGSLLFTTSLIAQNISEIERCYSHKAIEYQESLTPGFKQLVEEQFEVAKNHPENFNKNNHQYTIPVVVHIVYNTADQNLADSVILRQIETLNEDFQRLNADTVNMRGDFDIVKGSPGIEFMLAQIDPAGNPTTGITRTQTTHTTFGSFGLMTGDMSSLEKVKQTAESGIDPWDQSRYMNIWVCNMEIMNTPFLLGYATPPVGLSNWPIGSTGNLGDGVVIQYQAFGDNNPNDLDMGQGPLDVRGRTTTHEVGHYLGLRHIWADGGCNKQDGIDDTPNAVEKSNQDCDPSKNTCLDTIQGVDLPDMIENYMDYSSESCQNSFTKGQCDHMHGVLENQRYDLVHNNPASLEKEEILTSLYPNPANNTITLTLMNGSADEITIFDLNGKLLYSTKDEKAIYDIDISTFDSGMYFAKISKMGRVVSTTKFIKR